MGKAGSSMSYIRTFAELDRNQVALAGGKGANLGDMVRAGLPVPPGFVLLTPAYREFVAAHGLQPEIGRLAAQARSDDPDSLEAASAAIRRLFDQGGLPPAIAEAVAAAYRTLGEGRVAVRSSATAEDLPGASFAGQQETYLNIEGEEQLLDAVRRCWSSLWTGRAIAYRLRQGIAPADVALAVVVQRQVEAESAGILFTANPVTGRRDQMVIDGAWGLGEAVVSGQVTPDRWVADGASGAILEAQIARKLVMTVRAGGVTATVPVPDPLQEKPAIDPVDVADLVLLGRRVAAHFGSPQDIEWARTGGHFYLVQSRPITSLFPIPAPASGEGLRVYLCFNILQGLVEPFTPMGIALFRAFGRGPATLLGYPPKVGGTPAAFKVAAGRIYLDVSDPLRNRYGHKMILAAPSIVDKQTAQILAHLAQREEELRPTSTHWPIHPPPGLILLLACRMAGAWIFPGFARRRGLAQTEALYRELERKSDQLHDLAAITAFLLDRPADLFLRMLPRLLPGLGIGQAGRFIAEEKLQKWLGDGNLIQPVLRALPHNPTTQMDLALWRVSRQLKAEGARPSAEHPAVKEFLEQYGHRAVREIDVGMPRWSDDPGHVLNVLATYLTHGEEADPEAHFRRGAAEAEAAVESLVARVRREKGLLRAWLLRFLLRRVRANAGMREWPKFYMVRMQALWRRLLKRAGAQLVAAGRLEQADEIFFLDDLADLIAGGDLRPKVAAARAEYERELLRRSAPRVVTSLGETFYAAPAAAEGGLAGTPASPGVHEGRVRVIHDPKGAKLEPGEVLVAPGTDPAWTPLFLTAGALVMEIGGIMSHGSVVAREYGIPAVVGVLGATQQLRTGQRVRVDGEAGVVTPLED